ncbi:hypothetical protein ACWFR1_19355 [Streptomyces sp. NPDC055103]
MPAPASAPTAESSVVPAQEVAPQIVEGPAREALEAALPAPPPSAAPPSSSSPAPRPTPPPASVPASAAEQDRRTAAPPRPRGPRPTVTPGQREVARPEPRPAVPELPGLAKLPKEAPRSRADVCDLGERYGGWDPRSDQARICHGTDGR